MTDCPIPVTDHASAMVAADWFYEQGIDSLSQQYRLMERPNIELFRSFPYPFRKKSKSGYGVNSYKRYDTTIIRTAHNETKYSQCQTSHPYWAKRTSRSNTKTAFARHSMCSSRSDV